MPPPPAVYFLLFPIFSLCHQTTKNSPTSHTFLLYFQRHFLFLPLSLGQHRSPPQLALLLSQYALFYMFTYKYMIMCWCKCVCVCACVRMCYLSVTSPTSVTAVNCVHACTDSLKAALGRQAFDCWGKCKCIRNAFLSLFRKDWRQDTRTPFDAHSSPLSIQTKSMELVFGEGALNTMTTTVVQFHPFTYFLYLPPTPLFPSLGLFFLFICISLMLAAANATATALSTATAHLSSRAVRE